MLPVQLGISLDPTGVPIPETDYNTASEQVARLRPIVANMAFTTAQVKMVVDAFEVGGSVPVCSGCGAGTGCIESLAGRQVGKCYSLPYPGRRRLFKAMVLSVSVCV